MNLDSEVRLKRLTGMLVMLGTLAVASVMEILINGPQDFVWFSILLTAVVGTRWAMHRWESEYITGTQYMALLFSGSVIFGRTALGAPRITSIVQLLVVAGVCVALSISIIVYEQGLTDSETVRDAAES